VLSYLNEEQQEHMKELAEIQRDKRCKCGWYLKDDCPHCVAEKANNQIMQQAATPLMIKTLFLL